MKTHVTNAIKWHRAQGGDGISADVLASELEVYKRDCGSGNQPAWMWAVFVNGKRIAHGSQFTMAQAKRAAVDNCQ